MYDTTHVLVLAEPTRRRKRRRRKTSHKYTRRCSSASSMLSILVFCFQHKHKHKLVLAFVAFLEKRMGQRKSTRHLRVRFVLFSLGFAFSGDCCVTEVLL